MKGNKNFLTEADARKVCFELKQFASELRNLADDFERRAEYVSLFVKCKWRTKKMEKKIISKRKGKKGLVAT